MLALIQVLALIIGVVSGEVYFSETFPNPSSFDAWVSSTFNGDKQGKYELSAGESPADPVESLGLMTTEDAKFYGISRKFEMPVSSKGKTFVVQYTVKYEKAVTCGGSYMKLLGSDIEQPKFHGETPYKLMFGPDMCGYSTKKVHVIFNYKGQNHLMKKEPKCKDDLLTHLYTLIIEPNCHYKLLIDNEVVEQGAVEDDWDMLPPKKIDDPEAKKPSDWVDEPEMDDVNDKKPDNWDQPEKIPDPDAKKPEDWDDEMDGEWERPQIDNPDYKGEWAPKRIPNPDFKGPWEAPKIDNPEFKPDENLCVLDDVAYAGFDLWQVESGTIFDNILITDDVEFARSEGERLWQPRHKIEKELDEKKQEADRKKAEEDAKKEEEEKDSDEKTDESSDIKPESEAEGEKPHEEL